MTDDLKPSERPNYRDLLEPECKDVKLTDRISDNVVALSIAISLKRIADMMVRDGQSMGA